MDRTTGVRNQSRVGALTMKTPQVTPPWKTGIYVGGGAVAKPKPKTELTAAGEQFVIPGAERENVAGKNKEKQGNLWD